MITELRRWIPGLHNEQSFHSPAGELLEAKLLHQLDEAPVTVDGQTADREIHLMLDGSLTPVPDKEYVRAILEIDSSNQALRESVRYLLEAGNKDRIRRKMRERQNQQTVSLEDILSPFSDGEKRLLSANLAAVQLNDGCTVGCAWCGLEANRRVTKAFDLDSLRQFSGKYGREIKRGALYFASDPFDWTDGEYTFTDVHSIWSRNAGYFPYVATAVPEGAEFSVIRFMETAFLLEELNRHNDSEFPSLARSIRLSRTDRNSARIEHVFSILRARGVSEDFIRKVFVLNLDAQTIENVGHFIKHPDRDAMSAKDSTGIMCMDGVVISPDKGVRAMTMRVPTKRNSMGIGELSVAPGKMTIPAYCHRDYYSGSLWTVRGKLAPFALLPSVKLLHVRNGRIIAEEIIQSVSRDALTFVLVTQDLEALGSCLQPDSRDDFLRSFIHGSRDVAEQVEVLRKGFATRAAACLDRVAGCEDLEAVEIAREYIKRAEKLFSDLAQNLQL